MNRNSTKIVYAWVNITFTATGLLQKVWLLTIAKLCMHNYNQHYGFTIDHFVFYVKQQFEDVS